MSNQGFTVVITIGRNINGVPMAPQRWEEFRRSVDAACFLCGTVVQGPGNGNQRGVWQGKREDACAWVVLANNEADIEMLKGLLLDDKQEFEQDAIGFIVVEGQQHLI